MWRTVQIVGIASLIGACGCSPDAMPPGVRVVTAWAHHGQPAEHAAMQAIVAEFNRAHRAGGVHLAIEFFPDRQYAEKVAIASAAGRLPDVLEIDGPYVGAWAAEGLLQPLDPHVDAALRDDFLPTVLAQGTYADQLYALGAFDSCLVVYYNRDILEKANISPPQHPAEAWTWAEFVEALEVVRPHAAIPLSLHMDEQGDEWFTYAFAPLIWSSGGQLIDTRAHRTLGVLDSPTNRAAVTQWSALFREGLAEATSTEPNPFGAGLAAFDWTGHWMLPGHEATEALRFGAMPIPRMGTEQVGACGSWCWGISRNCADAAAASEVVCWLVHPKHGIQPIVEANGAIPSRKSAFALFPEFDAMPRRLFREQLESGARVRPQTGAYFALTRSFAQALRDVALGAEVDTRLHEAAADVQRILDRRVDAAGGEGDR